MHRRSLFVRFAATSLWTLRPFGAVAKSGSGRVHRVAVMKQGAEGLRPSFRDAMEELGYVEGRNLLFETRGTKGDDQRFPSLIAELIATKPEVIVAETTVGALAAKRAGSAWPKSSLARDTIVAKSVVPSGS